MKVYLFGGPGDGRHFEAYGDDNRYEVFFQEEAPIEWHRDTPQGTFPRPPIHIYARINHSHMFAHDCRGRCDWPDVPGHWILAGNEKPLPTLHIVEAWLRSWAETTRASRLLEDE